MSQAVSYALYPAKTLKNTDFFLIFQSEHKEACHSNIILHKIRPRTIFFKVFINGLFISSAEKDREWHVPHVKAPNSNKTSMKYREFLRGCFISLLPSAYFPRRVQKKKHKDTEWEELRKKRSPRHCPSQPFTQWQLPPCQVRWWAPHRSPACLKHTSNTSEDVVRSHLPH